MSTQVECSTRLLDRRAEEYGRRKLVAINRTVLLLDVPLSDRLPWQLLLLNRAFLHLQCVSLHMQTVGVTCPRLIEHIVTLALSAMGL